MSMTREQIAAVQRVGLALLETIEEQGSQGAPSGPMYAAMMAQGCSLSQYQSIMGSMESRGLVTQPTPDLYVITDAGRAFAGKLRVVTSV